MRLLLAFLGCLLALAAGDWALASFAEPPLRGQVPFATPIRKANFSAGAWLLDRSYPRALCARPAATAAGRRQAQSAASPAPASARTGAFRP